MTGNTRKYENQAVESVAINIDQNQVSNNVERFASIKGKMKALATIIGNGVSSVWQFLKNIASTTAEFLKNHYGKLSILAGIASGLTFYMLPAAAALLSTAFMIAMPYMAAAFACTMISLALFAVGKVITYNKNELVTREETNNMINDCREKIIDPLANKVQAVENIIKYNPLFKTDNNEPSAELAKNTNNTKTM